MSAQSDDVFEALAMVPPDDALLTVAGRLDSATLRSLDAIHIAAAGSIAPITAFITYDDRQSMAARRIGLMAAAPGLNR